MRDIEISAGIIGPVPLVPGVESEFVFRVRNLGPNATGPQTRITAAWPREGARVVIPFRAEPPCYAFTNFDGGDPPPPDYELGVFIDPAISAGATINCRFSLTTNEALPRGTTIRFDAYNGSYTYANDPDPTNNVVILGIGPALPAVVDALDWRWGVLLALCMAAIAAFAGGRSSPRRMLMP